MTWSQSNYASDDQAIEAGIYSTNNVGRLSFGQNVGPTKATARRPEKFNL
jgi:hypothetical protein